jgi:hypothetical protein
MEQMRNAYSISVGKSERKRPRGRPRSRWEGNIRKSVKEGGRKVLKWMRLTQDRYQWWALIDTIINIWFP